MSMITQCPECSTRFRVSQEQLEAHQGLVRCGRCHATFDARANEYSDGSSPQLDLPIAPAETAAAVEVSDAPISVPEPREAPAADEAHDILIDFSIGDEDTDEEDEAPAAAVQKRPVWPWAIGSSLFVLLLLAQAAYFFRVDLAARMPGLKPALSGYCSLFGGSIPLPRDASLMSIETSNLEADPAHANLITLTATLRNKSPHAPYTQAYPSLELTLLDAGENPVARKIFKPADYLRHPDQEKLGLAANRETDIKLNLDTSDLKPSGYRLLLFYPT